MIRSIQRMNLGGVWNAVELGGTKIELVMGSFTEDRRSNAQWFLRRRIVQWPYDNIVVWGEGITAYSSDESLRYCETVLFWSYPPINNGSTRLKDGSKMIKPSLSASTPIRRECGTGRIFESSNINWGDTIDSTNKSVTRIWRVRDGSDSTLCSRRIIYALVCLMRGLLYQTCASYSHDDFGDDIDRSEL